jgi:hypothetical protein
MGIVATNGDFGMKKYIVHCKKDKYDIYCGRPTAWGNQFEIGKDGDRDEVIKKYEQWIICGNGQYLLKVIKILENKVLGCWCYPEKCHCDILHLLSKNFKPRNKDLFEEYLKGFIACFNSKVEDDNPYPDSGHERDTTFQDEQQYNWYCGYWDCANYLDNKKDLYK